MGSGTTHDAPAGEDELVATLRSRGQRATPQRIVLLRALRSLGRHVRAEEVLGEASAQLPTLSLPTVYATLELFEELGLVQRVQVAGVALYEPVLDGHAHFTCRRCGAVHDLDLPLGRQAGRALGAAAHAGHAPESAGIVVSGVCAECAGATGRT